MNVDSYIVTKIILVVNPEGMDLTIQMWYYLLPLIIGVGLVFAILAILVVLGFI